MWSVDERLVYQKLVGFAGVARQGPFLQPAKPASPIRIWCEESIKAYVFSPNKIIAAAQAIWFGIGKFTTNSRKLSR